VVTVDQAHIATLHLGKRSRAASGDQGDPGGSGGELGDCRYGLGLDHDQLGVVALTPPGEVASRLPGLGADFQHPAGSGVIEQPFDQARVLVQGVQQQRDGHGCEGSGRESVW